ncbi:antibiotic biosynthesis monooxygenase [Marinomonas sp. 15G1-11]|uniref:Antibiotic biosynthesis monooxygenase n=1 Tax=Marinomonas phaeophyticola TaxID=3004091 RepID=A0ABT4JWM0_9GAMM|nr:antibiotic biosynthesis monooxygenase [Marinomonas sp. 15G1-11]MCZ2722698.1 antibiotic biosynthesis monooxygenase [Marinomonas sp. 15G1-11]
MSVTVVVTFKVKPDLVKPFIELLESNQIHMIQAGALSVVLLKGLEKKNHIVEIEKWESIEDHKSFGKAISTLPHFKNLEEYLLEPYKVMYLDTLSRQDAF